MSEPTPTNNQPQYPAGPQGQPQYPATYPAQAPFAQPNQNQLPSWLGPQPEPKKSKKLLWIGLASGFAGGVLFSVLVAGIAGVIATSTVSTVLPDAVKSCNLTDQSGVSLGDKNTSLSVDTKGQDDSDGASIADYACIVKALHTPDAVIEQMDSTSSLQGRQTAEWDGLEASWTYHPDSGVKLIVTLAKK
ncbi:hypothetical protein ACQR35_04360 [Pseudarthrobacter sp. J1738]|uniref:hypothetical protein n=1 Tax=Pseudarthrobacter sp. J1738 TaxID=3420446 RepID=UPI003D2798F6